MVLQPSNRNKGPFPFSFTGPRSDTEVHLVPRLSSRRLVISFLAASPQVCGHLHNEAEIFNWLKRVMKEWFSLRGVANTERKHLFDVQRGPRPATKDTPMREDVHTLRRISVVYNANLGVFAVTHQHILSPCGSLHAQVLIGALQLPPLKHRVNKKVILMQLQFIIVL